MSAAMIRRALISVHDKTGIVDFARALHGEFGVEIISTGGTAETLRDGGVPVTLVEDITGFPEMLDGRVKTLHPKIHAAILADRDNPEHMRQLAEQGIEPIDMVVVNLYPFEKTISRPDCTFEQAIEMIDIGGPCLLRAAAKNHRHVLVLYDPRDCENVLTWLREDALSEEGWAEVRRDYGDWVFRLVSKYNAAIATFLAERPELGSAFQALFLSNWDAPRYGENPHQSAQVFSDWPHDPLGSRAHLLCLDTHVPRGTVGLSFNNYADASAALELCAELTRAVEHRSRRAACFIKHTNACGAAVGDEAMEVYQRAYLGDPNAAMGGILAVNFAVDVPFAEAVMETYQRWGKAAGAGGFFVEVWIAPSFDDEAVKVIRAKKSWGARVRLLAVGDMSQPPDLREMDFKRIVGGMLVQTRDLVGLNEDRWQVVSKRVPDEREMDDLRLAWLVCKHTKSNAITICRDGMLIGNGAGQMSRVMSCRIATWSAQENGHANTLAGAVAASDGFFPFRDGPDVLADAGVTALIQPGGSKRDEDVIAACNERGLAMVHTGTRHFRH